jgi:hypothetical protein
MSFFGISVSNNLAGLSFSPEMTTGIPVIVLVTASSNFSPKALEWLTGEQRVCILKILLSMITTGWCIKERSMISVY